MIATMLDLTGKRAVVIGGTGVLGGQFCRTLAAAGAEVLVLGRDSLRGERVVEDIVTAGGRAQHFSVDIAERASLEAVRDAISDGGLDVLVNAAGVNSTTAFTDIDDEEWFRLQDINLAAVFRACQIFSPLMVERENAASIINISSASSGPPLSRVLTYGVAKAGVNNLTQYLARELAEKHIRVNALVPGFFPAEQNRAVLTEERVSSILGHTPMNRLGDPGDLDGALLWLASSRASAFVTGALIPVDGGFSAMTI
ncbi:SDR family oxidoreductase [Microbacterium sp. KRD172]|uniref:SDR family oxidoreductase n=1 Tax=Microbacterium sp. KRD172 TaxID=2729727 RepID=UPI0019D1FB82|nr:SDR family oxidoreductase [Microbacterium sp. KRD172]